MIWSWKEGGIFVPDVGWEGGDFVVVVLGKECEH